MEDIEKHTEDVFELIPTICSRDVRMDMIG